MSDTAAHLCDRVFPAVPVRQWVLSLPLPLRYLLAWDTELAGDVVALFVQAMFRHLRRVAKAELRARAPGRRPPGRRVHAAAQGGAANSNVHLHAMVADGVFVRQADGAPRFRALPDPSPAEVAQVAWDVCQRVVALLRRRGQWLDAPPEDDLLAQREPLLAQLYAGCSPARW